MARSMKKPTKREPARSGSDNECILTIIEHSHIQYRHQPAEGDEMTNERNGMSRRRALQILERGECSDRPAVY